MEFEYPEKPKNIHKKIVEKLLKGEFIPIGRNEYETLIKFHSWYTSFFLNSFSIELQHKEEVFYCVNPTGGMKQTREILTVTAILMYELSKGGSDPVVAIQNEEFSLELLNKYISESVQFSKFAEKNRLETRFINKLEAFGLIRKLDNEKFVFTRAIDIFLSEYDDLAEQVRGLE